VVLAADSDGFEHFVLVTGDGDFLPVVLELKRRGRDVSAVGVTGSSNMALRKAVDHFRYFEGLRKDGVRPVAAPAETASGAATGDGPPTREQLDQLRDVLRAALAARSPMTLGQVPGTLKRLLPWPFSPLAFGYKSVGGFLRRYRTDLGLDLTGPGTTPPSPSARAAGARRQRERQLDARPGAGRAGARPGAAHRGPTIDTCWAPGGRARATSP
jgi:hypothetical protein